MRAKPIDMKQLKGGCWKVIKEIFKNKKKQMEVDGAESTGPVKGKFNVILKKVVSQKCAESISRNLIFFSILHLCNE